MNKKSFVIQGSILASAGIITRIIGFVYRIPMANIMGNTGNGIYSVAFGIYNIALIMSSYSMPVAVSKLISENLGEKAKYNPKNILRISLMVSVMIGMLVGIALFGGSTFLEKVFYKPGLSMSLKVLAITVVLVGILGTIRGYFQGYGNMVPTSLSQIIEQILNAIVSIVMASQLATIMAIKTNTAAVKAAGGTIGTFAGVCGGLLTVLLFFLFKKRDSVSVTVECGENKRIIKMLIMIMIPIIMSQTVYQIGYTIDDFVFATILKNKNIGVNIITSMQGVFNVQYTQLINLPVGVATAFGVTIMPRISLAQNRGDIIEVKKLIEKVLIVIAFVAIPATIGMTLCAEEIMTVLFPGLKNLHDLAVYLLRFGSVSAIFYSFATVTSSVLQGCSCFKIPVINSFISLVVHIMIIVPLLLFTNLNTIVLLIGDMVFPLIIFILNYRKIGKVIHDKICFIKVICKPCIGTIVMGCSILVVKIICNMYACSSLILLASEIIIGMLAYVIVSAKIGLIREIK